MATTSPPAARPTRTSSSVATIIVAPNSPIQTTRNAMEPVPHRRRATEYGVRRFYLQAQKVKRFTSLHLDAPLRVNCPSNERLRSRSCLNRVSDGTGGKV